MPIYKKGDPTDSTIMSNVVDDVLFNIQGTLQNQGTSPFAGMQFCIVGHGLKNLTSVHGEIDP